MPSRRALITMTEAEAQAFAQEQRTLIIVSNGHDGFPHPMPMWFAVDESGRFLVSTFARSQKVRNFERDPRATLLIEDGNTYQSLQGLVVKANTEILDDPEEVLDTMVLMRLKNSEDQEVDLAALREATRPASQKRVILRFTPESVISWDHSKLGGTY